MTTVDEAREALLLAWTEDAMKYKTGPVPPPREWDRTDYADAPGPPRRSDFSVIVLVQGAVVFAAIVMFVVLASLVFTP